MPGDIIVPASTVAGALRLRPDQLHYELDGDALQWLKTLPEAVEDGDKLYVVIHEDQEKPYYIMQIQEDGTHSLLWRTDHLGEDTYTALRRMRFIPINKRLDEIERQEEKDALDQAEAEREDLYERIGGPMYHMLHRYGFSHGGKAMNAPLRNPTARRARAHGQKP